MKHDIIGGSTFPMLRVYLNPGENIKAESGAMVAMTRSLKLSGKMDGGFLRAMARKFSGESFFLQNIEAENEAGWVMLATAAPGEIAAHSMKQGESLTVQKNGFFAGTQGINVSTKVQSLTKGLFSGEGLFVVKLTGSGTVFLSTFGAMYAIDLPKGEDLLVDNGHLVAWDSDMKYDIVKGASSWTSSMTSGEGLACRFFGPGRIMIQTRNPNAFGAWVYPYLSPYIPATRASGA